MKYVWDTDTDRPPIWLQADYDRSVVGRMCHEHLHGGDLIDVLGMLFGPMNGPVTS